MAGMLAPLSRRLSHFLRRATDESIRADVIGALFLLGGLLGAISLVFPHPPEGELAILGVVVAAAITGAALIGRSTRWSTPWIHGAVAFGSVCINVMMLASGVASGVYAAMFCWVVLVSVNFFSLRAAAAHFAWMMGSFALVLTVVESGSGYSPFTRWITLALALAVTGFATAWLVYRRRLAEESAQRFLDLSQEMLCTISSDGCLTRVNRAWERTLGHPIGSLLSISVLDLVHPLDRARTEQALAKLQDGTAALMLETRIRGGDGKYQRLSWNASFSDDEKLIYARVKPLPVPTADDLSGTPLREAHPA